MKYTLTSLSLISLFLSACGPNKDDNGGKGDDSNQSNQTKVETYGKLSDGSEVKIFTFGNKNGMIAKVTEYGACLLYTSPSPRDS